MNVKKIILIILLVSFFVMGLSAIYLITNRGKTKDIFTSKEQIANNMDNKEKTEEVKPVVQFEVTSTEITVNKQTELKIIFPNLPEPAPTALTLHLTFDPKVIKVNDISEGDLWTGVNILERKIDNEKGDVKFSAGQGFEDKVTGKTTLAIIKVTALSNENPETSITIEDDSAIASVGINRLIYLKGMPLKIEVNK